MVILQTSAETMTLVAALAGPLIGAGAGSYFGLKGALNGLKAFSHRAEAIMETIRDTNREALFELREHRKESLQWVGDLKGQVASIQP